ncbi:MAG TPA: Lsr2 family protein [Pseudonocardiaceae bacterium]|nr:Lsr2 family protein [Pseudonocardiaceae bacterium]
MAQRTIVQFVDDLDGTSSDTVRTVEFGLDGVTYEIDLNDDHAGELRSALDEFITSARRTGGRRSPRIAATPATATPRANTPGRTREQTQAIRQWANKNGFEVSDRGRIPAAVIEAFDANAGQSKRRRAK